MPGPSPQEFEHLVHQHHAAVYRSAARVCGDVTEAADVTQDVFLRLLRGKIRSEQAVSMRATLCWFATRLAANSNRSRRRRGLREEVAMRNTTPTHADPARVVADADQVRKVAAFVADLPRDLRLPVQLRCQDELTFAAIGSALAISESTAHERYRAGIDRLRDRMRRRGAAVPASALPAVVSEASMPAVPPGLEAKLLALVTAQVTGAFGLVGSLAGVSVAATVALALAVSIAAHDGDVPPPTAAAATVHTDTSLVSANFAVQEPPMQRRQVPPPPVRSPLQEPVEAERLVLSVFHGTVRDAGGFAVVQARVQAVAGGGLKPFELGETTTDAEGAFRLEIGRGKLPGMAGHAKLRVHEGIALLMATADYALPRAESADAVHLVLPASVGTAATRYHLEVTVRGANGAPLANVPVTLYPAVGMRPRPGGGRGEVEAATDALGVARLDGRLPGDKWLFVDGREQGHTASFTAFAIPAPGEHEHRLLLAAGGALHVSARPLAGGRPEHLSVWLEDDNGLQFQSDPRSGGDFTFEGLADAPHSLHVAGFPWSTVRRDGLRPSPQPVSVELKRADDPRDIGDHMAEVHGHFVDAKTGELVPWEGFAIESFPRRDGVSTLLSDVIAPARPMQRMIDGSKHRHFHETALAAGKHVLVLRVDGYGAVVREVTLGPSEVISDLEVPLVRGASMLGRVVDEDGNPVAKAYVFPVGVGPAADANLRRIDEEALTLRDSRWPCLTLCSFYTRADGRFGLHGLPPDTPLRLAAVAPGYRLEVHAPNALRPGQKAGDLVLRLRQR